ncbi:MAG TPA: hypothetical protein VM029_22845, partial [Opitutaceae bacterium]|nr:hypothetical protein [Opitutaceae bacterium]
MTPPAPTSAADDFVLQLAVEHGLLQSAQVDAARAIARGHADGPAGAPRVLDLLQQQGVLHARQVAELVAHEFGMQMAP